MTQKDYIRIARAIKSAHASIPDTPHRYDRRGVYASACAIATELQADNVNFNRCVFMIACGFDEHEQVYNT